MFGSVPDESKRVLVLAVVIIVLSFFVSLTLVRLVRSLNANVEVFK